MQNQNDIKEFSKTANGQTDLSQSLNFNFKAFYNFTNKKTEKLVTALYMVTDCMETGDALKGKLRSLAIDLLSQVHEMATHRDMEKHTTVGQSLTHIAEISSLVSVAATIGFISEMNAKILQKEFTLLSKELARYQAQNAPRGLQQMEGNSGVVGDVVISESMLDVALPVYKEKTIALSQFWENNEVKNTTADFYKGHIKDTMRPSSFPPKTNAENRVSRAMSQVSSKTFFENKDERKTKILGLIKDKKEVSIKDISYAFTDCSEKTIQRELNALVANGQIKKIGEKRWSRYSVL